jgi:hypothetical protein
MRRIPAAQVYEVKNMAQAKAAASTTTPAPHAAGPRQQSWGRSSTVSSEDLDWAERLGLDWRDMLNASK